MSNMIPAFEYVVYALVVNFTILIVPGQIFFLILQEASRSKGNALQAVLGVVVAEVMLLLLLLMGFATYLQQAIPVLRLAGSILLFVLGVQSIMRARQPATAVRMVGPNFSSFYRGFLMTGLNPPFIVWLFTVGLSVIDVGYSNLGMVGYLIFSTALLSASLSVAFILILAASASRNILGDRVYKVLSIISGVAFIILGANMLYPQLTSLQ